MDRVFARYFYETKYINQTPLLLYQCLMFIGINITIVALLLFFFREGISKMFGFSPELTWLILIIGVIINILLNFASLIPKMFQQGYLFSIGEISTPFLFLICIVPFMIFHEKNALSIVTSQCIAMTTTLIILVCIYKNVWTPPKKILSVVEITEIKRFIFYGFPFIFSSGLDWLFFNLDKFLLLRWSSYYALGIYTAAFSLSSILETGKSIFMSAWIPQCNKIFVESPFRGKKIFHDTFHTILWSFTIILLLLLLLKPVLILFLGKEYYAAGSVYGWLLLGVYFFILSEIVVAGLLKYEKTCWNIAISLLSVGINIIACYFLIPYFGAEGAAIANAFGFFIFFILRCYIAFLYYPFRIIWPMFFSYVAFIIIAICLTNKNFIYSYYCYFTFFIIYSFVLEKKRLLPILKIVKNRLERQLA
ncbi:MAG: hypothetical protein A3E82_06940 [Gammaproteobacteria bacterium RIFCSPHIGHO2_12_FULL_38_11]|nr:MAG: hypothetical protein A3E82_06940 [Gammaproteobacteria bacterium RIFCSPHIGHO2_12_FULL_38_11]